MSDSPFTDTETRPRQRTASRLRFVAPPGLSVEHKKEVPTIGRYEVIKTLGKGAMGVVYKCRDPLLDRIVAVKTIGSPRGVGRRVREAYLERFEREAKAAAKMQHPAIVTIFDVGLENGLPFMVLEYLESENLADRLDRVRMPLGKAVQIGLDLASALSFAHKQRIVHRDLKPANVLHAGEDRWKLADFGIARLPDSDLTQVGIFMGTPGYSPPEAIREGRYTPQADVFAWGAVLYELLSGYIPYEGPDTQTTNGFVLKGTAPSPRHYDPSIPEPLADVVMTALGASNGRYRDGGEAEKALRSTWQKCLTSNLVSPVSMAGIEVPHSAVTGPLHAPPTSSGEAPAVQPMPAAPPVQAKAPPTPPTPPVSPAGKAKGPAPFVIESSQISDDDPTTIHIRESDIEESKKKDKSTVVGGVNGGTKSERKDSSIDEAAATKRDVAFEARVTTTPPKVRSGFWVALFFVAAAAGVFAYILLS